MLDSKNKTQIDKVIKIINELNDNEKDLIISDINTKIQPFKNDGTLKKNNIKKEAAIRSPKVPECSTSKKQIEICPLCGKSNLVKKGKDNKGNQRYHCNACKKSFNENTATLTHGSKKDGAYWDELIKGMLIEESYADIAKRTNACISTVHTHALKVMSQILDDTDRQLLSGNIESDETYQTPNFRGDRSVYKFNFNGKEEIVHKVPDHIRYGIPTAGEIKALRRKGEASRGLSKEKVCYATAISQNYTFCGGPVKMGNINKSSLSKRILKNLAPDALFIGDSSSANKQFVKDFNIKNELVISSKDSRVGEYNLQKINYFHSELKRRMEGRNSFSTKHSEKYIAFIAWKIKNRKLTEKDKILAIKNMMRIKSKVDTWNEIKATEFPHGLRNKNVN
jgi:transposase-like protein